MKITYKSSKLEKVCTDIKVAEKKYGTQMAEKIDMRIGEISAADTVEMMVQFHIGRCHTLTQNRKGQYAVDLVHPYRLVFEKHGDEIQIAHILEIVDYH
ncbi:MAG: type II toxin-antitoxin system RelE/ParE family toxin [Lachnospiraceae bacterium]|nr:type II toxin-antitoxin system RelE/ParE family toxin [Lachnospiraceae bacterium]